METPQGVPAVGTLGGGGSIPSTRGHGMMSQRSDPGDHAAPSSYPVGSSHLSHWVFSEDQLANKRRLANSIVIDRISVASGGRRKDAVPLSAEEELQIVDYFTRMLNHLCNSIRLPYKVRSTGAIFFRRFFINGSVMEFDPVLIIATCLQLAMKVEDYHDLNIQRLLEFMNVGAGGSSAKGEDAGASGKPRKQRWNATDVYKNELPVLEGIGFHLLVIHPRNAARYLFDEYAKFVYSKDSATSRINQIVRAKTAEAEAAAQKLAAEVLQTDIPLLFTPSQIATGLFYIPSQERSLSSLEDFLSAHFGAAWDEKIRRTIHRLHTLVVKLHEGDQEAQAAQFAVLKEVSSRMSKFRKLLTKGKTKEEEDGEQKKKKRKREQKKGEEETPAPAESPT